MSSGRDANYSSRIRLINLGLVLLIVGAAVLVAGVAVPSTMPSVYATQTCGNNQQQGGNWHVKIDDINDSGNPPFTVTYNNNTGTSDTGTVVEQGGSFAGNDASITSLCIKAGNAEFGPITADGTYHDGCYQVSGIGTPNITVTRLLGGPDCQGISNIQLYLGDPATPTPTATPTNTPTATNTPTPTNTPVNTPTPTNTPVNTPTPTNTPVNTPTPTNTPVNTPTPTNTPVNTPTPTNTPVNTPTPTNTPVQPAATNTPVVIPTNTPVPPTPTQQVAGIVVTPTPTRVAEVLPAQLPRAGGGNLATTNPLLVLGALIGLAGALLVAGGSLIGRRA